VPQSLFCLFLTLSPLHPQQPGDTQAVNAWVEQLLQAPKVVPPLPAFPNLDDFAQSIWNNATVQAKATILTPQQLQTADEDTVVLPYVLELIQATHSSRHFSIDWT